MKKSKGFTLIELIVVIAVVLVLAGFLIPKFAGYQGKAKETKAINTAKQIHTAAMSSYSENEGKFDATEVSSSITSLTGAQGVAVIAADDSKSIDVTYTCDSENYKAKIDDSNGFTIYKVQNETETAIFPK